MFSKGVAVADYHGARTSEALVEYAERIAEAPLYFEFTDGNEKWLFQERPGYRHHVLLMNPDAEAQETMEEVAKDFVGRAVFAWVSPSPSKDAMYKSLNVEVGGAPSVKVVSSSRADNEMKFYESEDLGSAEIVVKFVEDVLQRKAEPASTLSVPTIEQEEEL